MFVIQLYDMHNSYDSVSSYDSYGVRMNGGSNGGSANLSTTLASNSQDDLKSGGTLGRHHDPYRFTRSTQQPVDAKMPDYPKYR